MVTTKRAERFRDETQTLSVCPGTFFGGETFTETILSVCTRNACLKRAWRAPGSIFFSNIQHAGSSTPFWRELDASYPLYLFAPVFSDQPHFQNGGPGAPGHP